MDSLSASISRARLHLATIATAGRSHPSSIKALARSDAIAEERTLKRAACVFARASSLEACRLNGTAELDAGAGRVMTEKQGHGNSPKDIGLSELGPTVLFSVIRGP